MPTYTALLALAFLLPGTAYYAGAQSAEPFPRETNIGSVVEELTRILRAALLVHAIALSLWLILGLGWASVSPTSLLPAAIPLLQNIGQAQSGANATWINQRFLSAAIYAVLGVLAYTVLASTAAFGFGNWARKRELSPTRTGGVKSRREWAYDLIDAPSRKLTWRELCREQPTLRPITIWWNNRADRPRVTSYTRVFTVTKMKQDANHLMYRGRLRGIAFAKGGRINFVTLEAPARSYLQLKPDFPETVPFRRGIGETNPSTGAGSRDLSFLVINAEEVANFVFERYTVRYSDSSLALLKTAHESVEGLDPAKAAILRDEVVVRQFIKGKKQPTTA